MRTLRSLIPASMKPALRSLWYWPADVIGWLKGRDSLTPPRSLIFVGDGDFKATGQEFKRYIVEIGGLKPDERVLDVSSGIGRMAVPLTDYLSANGEYQGFDIVEVGVNWCRGHISSRFKNFHFQHIDVYNKTYNQKGRTAARDFRFPFDDGRFDFVLLTSVFTHMMPADLQHYLSEISRVLRIGGRCLITFFLLNPESRGLLRGGRSTLDFRYEVEGCLITDKGNPEAAIAYDEDAVRRLYAARGLGISEPVRYGSWCGRSAFLSYQDIIFAAKTASFPPEKVSRPVAC